MNIKQIAIKKAQQSDCRYKVSAIGFNRKGDIIGTSCNKHRVNKPGQSIHAEIDLMVRHGRKLRSIVICRTNNSGDLLPIHPCSTCQKFADRYGVIIRSIK